MANASISHDHSNLADVKSRKLAALKEKTHLKILIIDDDGQFRNLMKRQLKEEGFHQIFFADNGEEGIRQAISVKPDIVILDTLLPPTDGFTVCKIIIQIPGLESTKIIMITTSYKNIDPKKSRRVGANIYTLKSKDFSCIMDAIAN